MSQITYRRLHDSSWGIKGLNLRKGDSVSVTKRSGQVDTVTVGDILWTDPDGSGMVIARIGVNPSLVQSAHNTPTPPSDISSEPDGTNGVDEFANELIEMTEQEKLLRLQLDQIAQKKRELVRLDQEKKAKLRAAKELEKHVDVTVMQYVQSHDIARSTLMVKFSPDRSDVRSILRPTYSYTFESWIPVIEWSEFESKLRALPNVNIIWKDDAKEKYEWHMNAPAWEIDLDPSVGNVIMIPGPKESRRWKVEGNIPGIYWNMAKMQYTVPRMESWRIPTALEAAEDVHYSDAARELIFTQIEKRAKLDIIAKKEDSTILADNGATLKGDLIPKPFQNVTIEFADAADGNLLIAHDTGLGKTICGLGFAELKRARNLTAKKFMTLVVCKASNIPNWVRETKRLTGVNPLVLRSGKPSGEEVFKIMMERVDYVIISYDTLGSKTYTERDRLIAQFGKDEAPKMDGWDKGFYPWTQLFQSAMPDLLIMDEAHQIKNPSTHRFKAIRPLNFIQHKMPMTASPILNRATELWPLLHMVAPHIFDNHEKFENLYTDGRNAKDVEKLHEMLRPMFLRYRKKDVQKDLPPINRIYRYHELSNEATKNYMSTLEGLFEPIAMFNPTGEPAEAARQVMAIIAMITYLKEIAAADKVDYTADLATDLVDEHSTDEKPVKVLIFSHFKATAYAIAQRLGNEAVCTVKKNLDKVTFDSMNVNDRDALFEDARHNPNVRYIVTTSAAQEGHNLEFCDFVIFNDLFWTPEAHKQCEGRAYGRLSNPHPIDSFYIIADIPELGNPDAIQIEKLIMELLEKKMAVIEETVDKVESTRDSDGSIGRELIMRIKDQMMRQGRRRK